MSVKSAILDIIAKQEDPWEPYEGPAGGEGWINVQTQEIRYQKEKPGAEEGAQEPEPEGYGAAPEETGEVLDEVPPDYGQVDWDMVEEGDSVILDEEGEDPTAFDFVGRDEEGNAVVAYEGGDTIEVDENDILGAPAQPPPEGFSSGWTEPPEDFESLESGQTVEVYDVASGEYKQGEVEKVEEEFTDEGESYVSVRTEDEDIYEYLDSAPSGSGENSVLTAAEVTGPFEGAIKLDQVYGLDPDDPNTDWSTVLGQEATLDLPGEQVTGNLEVIAEQDAEGHKWLGVQEPLTVDDLERGDVIELSDAGTDTSEYYFLGTDNYDNVQVEHKETGDEVDWPIDMVNDDLEEYNEWEGGSLTTNPDHPLYVGDNIEAVENPYTQNELDAEDQLNPKYFADEGDTVELRLKDPSMEEWEFDEPIEATVTMAADEDDYGPKIQYEHPESGYNEEHQVAWEEIVGVDEELEAETETWIDDLKPTDEVVLDGEPKEVESIEDGYATFEDGTQVSLGILEGEADAYSFTDLPEPPADIEEWDEPPAEMNPNDIVAYRDEKTGEFNTATLTEAGDWGEGSIEVRDEYGSEFELGVDQIEGYAGVGAPELPPDALSPTEVDYGDVATVSYYDEDGNIEETTGLVVDQESYSVTVRDEDGETHHFPHDEEYAISDYEAGEEVYEDYIEEDGTEIGAKEVAERIGTDEIRRRAEHGDYLSKSTIVRRFWQLKSQQRDLRQDLMRFYNPGEVGEFYEAVDGWKVGSGTSGKNQRLESAFKYALGIESRVRGEEEGSDAPYSREELGQLPDIAEAAAELSREYYEQMPNDRLYRGGSRKSLRSFLNSWLENPDSDEYEVNARAINNFDDDPHNTWNQWRFGPQVEKDGIALMTDFMFNPEETHGGEREIWVSGDHLTVNPEQVDIGFDYGVDGDISEWHEDKTRTIVEEIANNWDKLNGWDGEVYHPDWTDNQVETLSELVSHAKKQGVDTYNIKDLEDSVQALAEKHGVKPPMGGDGVEGLDEADDFVEGMNIDAWSEYSDSVEPMEITEIWPEDGVMNAEDEMGNLHELTPGDVSRVVDSPEPYGEGADLLGAEEWETDDFEQLDTIYYRGGLGEVSEGTVMEVTDDYIEISGKQGQTEYFDLPEDSDRIAPTDYDPDAADWTPSEGDEVYVPQYDQTAEVVEVTEGPEGTVGYEVDYGEGPTDLLDESEMERPDDSFDVGDTIDSSLFTHPVEVTDIDEESGTVTVEDSSGFEYTEDLDHPDMAGAEVVESDTGPLEAEWTTDVEPDALEPGTPVQVQTDSGKVEGVYEGYEGDLMGHEIDLTDSPDAGEEAAGVYVDDDGILAAKQPGIDPDEISIEDEITVDPSALYDSSTVDPEEPIYVNQKEFDGDGFYVSNYPNAPASDQEYVTPEEVTGIAGEEPGGSGFPENQDAVLDISNPDYDQVDEGDYVAMGTNVYQVQEKPDEPTGFFTIVDADGDQLDVQEWEIDELVDAGPEYSEDTSEGSEGEDDILGGIEEEFEDFMNETMEVGDPIDPTDYGYGEFIEFGESGTEYEVTGVPDDEEGPLELTEQPSGQEFLYWPDGDVEEIQ